MENINPNCLGETVSKIEIISELEFEQNIKLVFKKC